MGHPESTQLRDIVRMDCENDGLGQLRRSLPLRAGASSLADKAAASSLLSLIQKAVARLLTSLEIGAPSQSTFELQIGQIFTRGSSVSRRFQCSRSRPSEPLAPEEWEEVFDSRSGEGKAITIFSQNITSTWEDADYISNLPNPSRKHMFDSQPSSDTSAYRLICRNEKTGIQAVVEVLNDGRPAQVHPAAQEIGAINIHFPKQVWDAKISVSDTSTLDHDALSPFRAIADNLWIGAVDTTKPNVESLYSKRPDPCVSIVSAELRREIVYQARGTEKDVSLHLTRVEGLEIVELAGGFCAFLVGEEASGQSRTLWEAKLLSAEITKLFNEHSGSEIRGVSYWFASPSLKDPLHNLIHCADSIVRSIDDVGHSSRKRVAVSGSATKSSSKRG